MFGQLAGKLATINVILALGSDAAYRFAQGRDAHDFAGTWCAAIEQEFMPAGLFGAIVLVAAFPAWGASSFCACDAQPLAMISLTG